MAEPLSPEETEQLQQYLAQRQRPTVFPAGTLPVLPLTQTQQPRLPPASSFRPLLGGREAAIEGPSIPPWLSVAHEIVPALVGSGAAALSAPAAPLAGPLAPAVPHAAFATGSMGTERAMRAAERAAGYRTPPESTGGESAVEFGTQMLASVLGEKIPPLIGAGFRRAAGFTGRASDLAKAAEDMTTKLRKLDDLHISVGSDVAQLGGRQQKAQTLATAAVKKQAKELYDIAPQDLIVGRAPLYTAEQLGARAQELGTSAALRAQDVAPIEKAYRTVATGAR